MGWQWLQIIEKGLNHFQFHILLGKMYCQKIIQPWYYTKIKVELYDKKQIDIGGELIILSQNTKP